MYKPVYGTPQAGSFALSSLHGKPILWEHCRENFALKFLETTKGFFFSHLPDKTHDIANFLFKFENVVQCNLRSPELRFSQFRKTCRNNVMWIEPSEFWLNCKIKRSLLTILMRCAMNYSTEDDNFDDVLFGNYKENSYLRDTKTAFLRFMFGFTVWNFEENNQLDRKDERHGWREEFLDLDIKKIKTRLLPPNANFNHIGMVGFDALWS